MSRDAQLTNALASIAEELLRANQQLLKLRECGETQARILLEQITRVADEVCDDEPQLLGHKVAKGKARPDRMAQEVAKELPDESPFKTARIERGLRAEDVDEAVPAYWVRDIETLPGSQYAMEVRVWISDGLTDSNVEASELLIDQANWEYWKRLAREESS